MQKKIVYRVTIEKLLRRLATSVSTMNSTSVSVPPRNTRNFLAPLKRNIGNSVCGGN